MNANIKYEIEARAFQIATGFLAPGKDSPAAAGVSLDERTSAWHDWQRNHYNAINAMLRAFDEHLASE